MVGTMVICQAVLSGFGRMVTLLVLMIRRFIQAIAGTVSRETGPWLETIRSLAGSSKIQVGE